jgi:hypothetical protein
MLDTQYDFSIIKDKDIDNFKKDFDKVDTIKLDLKNNKLHPSKFEELFDRLSRTKISYFQLDLTNYSDLDNEKLESIVKCLRCWNLKTLILLFSHVKFANPQFESLIYESIHMNSNLENLYLDLENINFDSNKMRTLEKLIPKLKNLQNIYINVKSNHLTKEEITKLSKAMNHVPVREFIWC